VTAEPQYHTAGRASPHGARALAPSNLPISDNLSEPPTPRVFYMSETLRLSGPAKLIYAHFCDRALVEDSIFLTFERVQQHVRISPDVAGQLPFPSVLAMEFTEAGGAAGERRLRVVVSSEHGGLVAVNDSKVEFFAREEGFPLVCRQRLNLQPWPLHGPGIYYFEFAIDDQFVGRLPIVVSAGEPPPGLVTRVPRREDMVYLEWGHLMQQIDPLLGDPERAETFRKIFQAFPVAPAEGPFRFERSILALHLTAPDTLHERNHHLTILPRTSEGEALIPPHEMDFTLYPVLPPGELECRPRVDFSGLVYPGAGDYDFAVLVDGRPVGTVDLVIREVSPP
jgi:hypothetical protein